METAVEWCRVRVNGMKIVVKCERLVDEVGKQDIRRQQLRDVKLHLVCDEEHQTTNKLHLRQEYANNINTYTHLKYKMDGK